jgi:hypothetical protein
MDALFRLDIYGLEIQDNKEEALTIPSGSENSRIPMETDLVFKG